MLIFSRILLSATMLLCVVHLEGRSQIPNAGFENWTGSDPDGWGTSNGPPTYLNVTQSTTAHGGARAVRGEVVLLEGFAIQPVIQSGPNGEGFPHTQRSASFTGYYQFFPTGGDRFAINVILFSGGVNGTAVALAAAALSPSVSTYTAFNVPFLYFSGATPDTCVVQIQIIGPTTGNTWHAGSYFILDDIALTGTADVGDQPGRLPSVTRLLQNYPNPFNPSTTITYVLSASRFVALNVYDVLGREVAVLVNADERPGNHSVTWDARNNPSGVYYCRLTAGDFSETRKLTLAK